jgi:hypothetical protein
MCSAARGTPYRSTRSFEAASERVLEVIGEFEGSAMTPTLVSGGLHE